MEKEDFEIWEISPIEYTRSLVLVGYPGVGLAGAVAADYVVNSLGMKRVAAVYSKHLPPVAVVKEGAPTSPITIYASEEKCGPQGECDRLLVVSSMVPLAPEIVHPLGEALLDWCEATNSDVMVTMEGWATKEKTPDGTLYGVGTTDRARGMLSTFRLRPLDQGTVSGLAGHLLYLGERHGKDVVCLLVEAAKDYPDARAAASLVTLLQKMLPRLDIKPQPLLKAAEEIEKQMRESLARSETPRRPEDLSMYR
ncbi:MAG: proteasome assembly chaperone family protein [Candidatus Geothermarchaeales archaeon]